MRPKQLSSVSVVEPQTLIPHYYFVLELLLNYMLGDPDEHLYRILVFGKLNCIAQQVNKNLLSSRFVNIDSGVRNCRYQLESEALDFSVFFE